MTAGEPEARDEEFFADPHPAYRRWREEGGARHVVFPGGVKGWVVTGYAEARAALADPRLRKGAANEAFLRALGRTPPAGGGPASALPAHMLNSDPPDHTRLRKLVTRAFTTRRVAELRPRIEAITTGLLDAMAAAATDEADETDLVESFAMPLPIMVICELLGVPYADRAAFQVRGTGMMTGRDREAFAESARYLTDLVHAKSERPGDDLLSELIRARDDEGRLSEREVISMAFLLLLAGHETTVSLIANGAWALLTHPEQLAALRADPALIPGAVEEFLRWESPVNLATLRYTEEPVVIAGTRIPAGSFVHVALTSANRDADRFAEPDGLDIARDAGGHLAFGHGIHHCLGAPLARLEAGIAFTHLLRRFPGLRLARPGEAPRWYSNARFRGVAALPVRLG
ncbi:cytochrome P450 family protein [Streptomyces specialis]|uniref:cytochrome P450 family protein n=1 Tax=Streptomyces specialis TaxID=498367 RepID=UPI00073F31C0|nr:cytochrome P450 [Streptomyces specialis]